MIMVDPDGKKEIFAGWTEACRWAGKKCEVQLKSTKTVVEKIDSLTSKFIKK